MAKMTTYVDHIEIQKGLSKVQSFTSDNQTNENKIKEALDGLEQSILINSKSIPNKKEMVSYSMNNFNKSTNTCATVLNHTIDLYFKSKDHSVTLIRNEVSNLTDVNR